VVRSLPPGGPGAHKAASKLSGAGIRVAALDCDKAAQVARALGVTGYPTIKLFVGGKSTDYQGPRSAMALITFAQTQARIAGVKAAFGCAASKARVAMSRVLGSGARAVATA